MEAKYQDGFGPLESLLSDPTVTEILVNGPHNIFVERAAGRLERADVAFNDDAHVMTIIGRILTPIGRQMNESTPIMDCRLGDGTLVHIVIPPISAVGPAITLRKFTAQPMTLNRLVEFDSLSSQMADFLSACVQARVNILIAGSTGSGKTTVLNTFASQIPDEERILLLLGMGDLMLVDKPDIVILETRPPNLEGRGEITMRHLVNSAVKMRPDRIVVSELRGPETWDWLLAMNNGYDGTLASLHATGLLDALSRLEMMALEGNPSLPLLTIRQQIANGIGIIAYQERLRDGTRRMLKIAEVVGTHGDVIATQDIFEFVQTGLENGRITGHFQATGRLPRCYNQLRAAGLHLSPDAFGVRKA
jgi:pilus assembly protein CpaF